MYYCPETKTKGHVRGGLLLGAQGEHTKDAVYLDAERRFQELEKVH